MLEIFETLALLKILSSIDIIEPNESFFTTSPPTHRNALAILGVYHS